MGKGHKKIQVDVRETERDTEQFTDLELFVNNKKIGSLQQEESKPVTVITPNGSESKVKSIDEGINALIMEYNLHNS